MALINCRLMSALLLGFAWPFPAAAPDAGIEAVEGRAVERRAVAGALVPSSLVWAAIQVPGGILLQIGDRRVLREATVSCIFRRQ